MKFVVAALIGLASAVKVEDIDNKGSKDVGVAGYDPWVRHIINDNVEPYPAIPRNRNRWVTDGQIKAIKAKAEELSKDPAEEAKKEVAKEEGKEEKKDGKEEKKDEKKEEEKK